MDLGSDAVARGENPRPRPVHAAAHGAHPVAMAITMATGRDKPSEQGDQWRGRWAQRRVGSAKSRDY